MKKHRNLKGFIMGFLCCALLGASLTYAEEIYQTISVRIGYMDNILINNEPVNLDNILYEDRTYVPLRAIAQLFGKTVNYDAKTHQVRIDDRDVANMLNKDVAFLVNGEAVRVNYFTQMINWYKTNSGIREIPAAQREDFKLFVRNEIVGMVVTEQYAADLGVKLFADDQKAIDEKINVYANNFGGLDAFKQELLNEGITFEFYRSIQENYAIRSKLLDIVTEEISDNTLKQYYNNNKEAYKVETVRAKHILFSTVDEDGYPYSDSVKSNIKFEANIILKYILDKRMDFDTAMMSYSQDPGYQSEPDGYLFSRGEVVKAFEDAAFATKPGEVYPTLAESEIGYHIVKTIDKSTEYKPFETVRDSIYNSMRNDNYAQLIAPLTQEAEIILNPNTYDAI